MANMHRVRVVGTGWTGSPGLNTFYFLPSADTAAGALLCAQRVRAALTEIGPTMHLDTALQVQSEVDAVDEDSGDVMDTYSVAAQSVAQGTSNFAGGIGPSFAMGVLRLVTSTFISGRRVRGRAFIGPVSANAIDDGQLTTTAQTAITAMGTVLRTGSPAGPVLVVWHRPIIEDLDAVPPVTGVGGLACAVTSGAVNLKMGVLRSRRD